MDIQKLKTHFYLDGKRHAMRDMHSRPIVGDIVILKTGDYEISQVIWPYKDDNELDWLQCNCIINPVK